MGVWVPTAGRSPQQWVIFAWWAVLFSMVARFAQSRAACCPAVSFGGLDCAVQNGGVLCP
eukprot:3944625-Alexandrium_andersonii.AAC.1